MHCIKMSHISGNEEVAEKIRLLGMCLEVQ
jgi:hypothetical protein